MNEVASIFRQRETAARGDDFLHRIMREQLDGRAALVQNAASIVCSYNDIALTDDVPAYLAKIYTTLPANGCFMAAFYGGATLQELRTSLLAAEAAVAGAAARRVAPMLYTGTASTLLQRAGFALPVIDSEEMVLTYETIDALVADLRGSNLSGILREQHFLHRDVWAATAAHYAENFSDARERIYATFEIIFLSGWKNA